MNGRNMINVLQIWMEKNNQKPSESLLKNMKSIISKLSDNDTYTLISNRNYFSKIKKVCWINIDEYCNKMLEKDDFYLKGLWNFLKNKPNEAIFKSDIIRFHYASKNVNVLYVDCDVKIKKFPNFEDKVYFAQRNNIFFNNCLFYNGSNLKFFEDFLALLVRRTYDSIKNEFFIDMNWVINLLTNFRNQIILIKENEFFIHKDME